MNIAIVNDSPTALRALEIIVSREADLTVMWTAKDGTEAVQKCRVELPDLILMDIYMPVMDGIEATRQITKHTPCPILIVTASVDAHVGAVFEAMGAGAMDAVATPALEMAEGRRVLLEKIRSLLAITGIARPGHLSSRDASQRISTSCVLIGASAGGPVALMDILTDLPPDLRTGLVIIQHVDTRFASELASWLGTRATLPVRLADEGDVVHDAEVLIAKGGYHLTFGRNGALRYTDHPQLSYQPSIDVMYESALKYGPRRLLGIILTGMGRDGSKGLKQLCLAGHRTIVQDEATSAIYGMPRAAAEIGAAREILPLPKIAERIVQWSTSLS